MSSTMDQVQQLTNSQLCIMCYRYSISPQHAGNLNRRQLERRLHVAIIGERAKRRARQLLQPALQMEDLIHERSPFDEYHHLTLSEWRLMTARQQSILMGTERQSSGKERLELLDEEDVQQDGEEVDDAQDMPEEKAMYEKVPLPEHSELEIASKQELQQQVVNSQTDREFSIEHYEQDQATDYLSFSSSVNSRSCLSLDKALELPARCVDNQLQKSERFTCLDALSLACSDSEPDLSTERILCTINYLTEEQLLADDAGQLIRPRKSHEIIGHAPSFERFRTRRRPALWRYLLDMLFDSSPNSKMASHTLHYTILCCAMVICTLVGFKMMQ